MISRHHFRHHSTQCAIGAGARGLRGCSPPRVKNHFFGQKTSIFWHYSLIFWPNNNKFLWFKYFVFPYMTRNAYFWIWATFKLFGQNGFSPPRNIWAPAPMMMSSWNHRNEDTIYNFISGGITPLYYTHFLTSAKTKAQFTFLFLLDIPHCTILLSRQGDISRGHVHLGGQLFGLSDFFCQSIIDRIIQQRSAAL